MPFYVRRGRIPPKRHTVLRKAGGGIHYEELMGRGGFSGLSTLLYHLRMPTRVRAVGRFERFAQKPLRAEHRHRHLRSDKLRSKGDAISSRRLLLYNADIRIHKCHPDAAMDYFFRNGHFDELYFVQQGSGVLDCQLGRLEFRPGDYIVIPRGILWGMTLGSGKARFLLVQSTGPIATPARYRNRHGQMLEGAPFCERDIKVPDLQAPRDETGKFRVKVGLRDGIQDFVYDAHPFDVVGWDGGHFPWIFNIHDFEPITGTLHQPPPVHQTFEAPGFVVCSFVSRPFDFHPEAIPAPYPHSNVDSDEVLFYAQGGFMSRKGIVAESISLHPAGLPHGPHPGRYEASIGAKHTDELAVMIDTFRPLSIAPAAAAIDDPAYPLSWISQAQT